MGEGKLTLECGEHGAQCAAWIACDHVMREPSKATARRLRGEMVAGEVLCTACDRLLAILPPEERNRLANDAFRLVCEACVLATFPVAAN